MQKCDECDKPAEYFAQLSSGMVKRLCTEHAKEEVPEPWFLRNKFGEYCGGPYVSEDDALADLATIADKYVGRAGIGAIQESL